MVQQVTFGKCAAVIIEKRNFPAIDAIYEYAIHEDKNY